MLTAQRTQAIAAVATLLLATVLGLREQEPPAVPAATDSPADFSVDRAFADLRWIAAEPHAMASPAHRRVRERLVRELGELGLEVVVDSGITPNSKREPHRCELAWVENVVARLPGVGSDRALLLASHYDSVGTGPGAGDDGAAVAAMLETARVLANDARAGRRLRNDVVFLFTDGEEIALHGARHYVKHGTWRERVACVLNFEARGAAGPSILFETSAINADLIAAFRDVAASPIASSLAYEVYRRMPNDTDFSVFKTAGWKGLNFAFIGAHERYHTAGDTPENLDPRSLAHHGTTMLALARRLGDAEPVSLAADSGSRTYFSVCRAFVVAYPLWLQAPLTLLTLALVFFALRAAVRRDRIGRVSMRWAFGATVAMFALAVLTSLLFSVLLLGGDSELLEFHRVVTDGPRHFVAHFLLATSLVTFIALQTRERARADGIAAAGLIWGALAACVLTLFAPAASYVVTLPLLASALGFLAFTTRRRKGHVEPWRFLVLLAAALPTGLLVVPLLAFGTQALTFAAAPGLIACYVLALLLVAPLLNAAMAVRRLAIPIVTGGGAFVILAHAIWTGTLSREEPRTEPLHYVLDADATAASFVCRDEQVLRATVGDGVISQAKIKDLLPGRAGDATIARVAAESTSAPETRIEALGQEIDATTRRMRFRVVAATESNRFVLRAAKESRAWIESVAGTALDAEKVKLAAGPQRESAAEKWQPVVVQLHGVPAEPLEFTLAQPLGTMLELSIETRSYGVPLELLAAPPAPWMIPATWRADETIVVRRSQY